MDVPRYSVPVTRAARGVLVRMNHPAIAALKERFAKQQLLVRGESLIGPVGIAAAAILFTMIAMAAWWSMRGEQDAGRYIREQQVRVVANVLSHSAESMLINNELSGLRRLLVEAKQQHELSAC